MLGAPASILGMKTEHVWRLGLRLTTKLREHIPAYLGTYLIVTILLAITSQSAIAAGLTIYLDPVGDDDNNGLSVSEPVLTLSRAQEIAWSEHPDLAEDIDIVVRPGVYYGQEVVWNYFPVGKILRILPAGFTPRANCNSVTQTCWPTTSAGMPRFEANGATKPFIEINATESGQQTNVKIYGLFINHYRYAISLQKNEGSTIAECYFRNIGSQQQTGAEDGPTTTLLMTNSSYNLIRYNFFRNNGNFVVVGDPGLDAEQEENEQRKFHAVYMSDFSTYNTIDSNNLSHISGHAIKVRNASGYNWVVNNRIFNVTYGTAFQDYYHGTNEQPSFENHFEDNRLVSNGASLIGLELYRPLNTCINRDPPYVQRVFVENNYGSKRANDIIFGAGGSPNQWTCN